jgi:hypothetical protein
LLGCVDPLGHHVDAVLGDPVALALGAVDDLDLGDLGPALGLEPGEGGVHLTERERTGAREAVVVPLLEGVAVGGLLLEQGEERECGAHGQALYTL